MSIKKAHNSNPQRHNAQQRGVSKSLLSAALTMALLLPGAATGCTSDAKDNEGARDSSELNVVEGNVEILPSDDVSCDIKDYDITPGGLNSYEDEEGHVYDHLVRVSSDEFEIGWVNPKKVSASEDHYQTEQVSRVTLTEDGTAVFEAYRVGDQVALRDIGDDTIEPGEVATIAGFAELRNGTVIEISEDYGKEVEGGTQMIHLISASGVDLGWFSAGVIKNSHVIAGNEWVKSE